MSKTETVLKLVIEKGKTRIKFEDIQVKANLEHKPCIRILDKLVSRGFLVVEEENVQKFSPVPGPKRRKPVYRLNPDIDIKKSLEEKEKSPSRKNTIRDAIYKEVRTQCGHFTIEDITEATGEKKSTVQSYLKRLELAGYLAKVANTGRYGKKYLRSPDMPFNRPRIRGEH